LIVSYKAHLAKALGPGKSVARRNTPTQADLTRALKAALAVGINVGRVEIEAGKIVIIAALAVPQERSGDLDDELADFERQHGQD
jgi:hypothetical protein